MGELVQENRHEIVLRPVVVVQPQIEGEVGAEVRVDVVVGGIQVDARQLVRQRDVVPRAGQRRVWKVAEHGYRPGTSQYAGSQRRKLRANPDRHRAVQPRAPDARRVLEGDQPLLSEGRSGVAAYGRRRRGIVESDARRVEVDDDELRRTGVDGTGREDDAREREHEDAERLRQGCVVHGRITPIVPNRLRRARGIRRPLPA